ncbi:hypothetical protein ACONUD_13335 [Microbulbifer harenosus]|uniref:DUF4347 domain-containing protein n=1 Tax=Microbulbifer harenosus TaxID=2576840 RepID=A0ABY2UQQ2_9GAMM|nr:hypothetical protein [Microbulbifer harenosus]TLM79354.1 hypothetical protein FDY93_04470 [Microbulbifer harenosus]
MPPRHPVTDVGRVLNAATLTNSPVSDTKAATGGGSPATTGPTIHTLMVYDSSDARISAFAPILARAYYPRAKLVGVNSLSGLASALSKYSRIDTLIIDVHSGPGFLLIGGASPSLSTVQQVLAKSGVTVQSKIVFEGCKVMEDPIGTCQMVEKICGPNTQVVGFTYYSVTTTFEIDFTDFDDAAEIQSFYDDFSMPYMVPGLPSAENSVGKVITHGRRWFRDEYDATLPEDGTFRHIESLESLKSYTINTAEDARRAQADFSGPVVPGAKVTVTNVSAVARANEEVEATAEP